MRTTWTTTITALINRELKTFGGPNIEAPTKRLAEEYCQLNGLGYCVISGQLVSEIPTKEDGVTPDWDGKVDYDNLN